MIQLKTIMKGLITMDQFEKSATVNISSCFQLLSPYLLNDSYISV